MLRVLELGGILGVALISEDAAGPATFALLAAIALRHYDIAYRAAQPGVELLRAPQLLLGGWDGRLLLACGLALVGAARPGFVVLAVVIGGAVVLQAGGHWRRRAAEESPAGP